MHYSPQYLWKIVDKKSKERKEDEHAVTPGTRDWVHGNLLDDDRTFGLKVVNTEYPIYYFVMLRFLQDVFSGNQYYCTPIFSSWDCSDCQITYSWGS